MSDNQGTGPGQDPDRLIWMPSREAASVYDVAPRTIRKWRDAGKIDGRQLNGMWYIGVPREKLEESGLDIAEIESQYGESDEGMMPGTMFLRPQESEPGPVDLGPMAELIADLTQKAIDANTAAAMWQERTHQLQAQVDASTRALESGQSEATALREQLEREKQEAIDVAKREAAEERDREWRAKSWWQRMRGE